MRAEQSLGDEQRATPLDAQRASPPAAMDIRLVEGLARYLNTTPASGTRSRDLLRAASLALLEHRFDTCDATLTEVEHLDRPAPNDDQREGLRKQAFWSAIRAARGTLAALRNDDRTAAKHYATAALALPYSEHTGRWDLALAEANVLRRLGNATRDPMALTDAVAALKSALDQIEGNDDARRRAQTHGALGETLVDVGQMVGDSIGDIQAIPNLEAAASYYAAMHDDTGCARMNLLLGQCLERLAVARGDTRLFDDAARALKAALAATATDQGDARTRAAARQSLASVLFASAERHQTPDLYATAANAIEDVLTDESGAADTTTTALLTLELGTALVRAGAGKRNLDSLRRGTMVLRTLLEAAPQTDIQNLQRAVRICLGEGLSAQAALEKSADIYEEAASVYTDLLTDLLQKQPGSLMTAHAASGLGDTLRTRGTLLENLSLLDEAAIAKRKARAIFESAGAPQFVDAMERDLRTIYDLMKLLEKPPSQAKTA
jgi:tetratricopeptide (TPR) repeat protein